MAVAAAESCGRIGNSSFYFRNLGSITIDNLKNLKG
jgi:NADH:ubiquinone oxidoreductase subunit K